MLERFFQEIFCFEGFYLLADFSALGGRIHHIKTRKKSTDGGVGALPDGSQLTKVLRCKFLRDIVSQLVTLDNSLQVAPKW